MEEFDYKQCTLCGYFYEKNGVINSKNHDCELQELFITDEVGNAVQRMSVEGVEYTEEEALSTLGKKKKP